MRYRRLFLAGDAAPIRPPTGAKGLNLAVADVAALATALVRLVRDGRPELADAYSDHCLERVWRGAHPARRVATHLHAGPGAGVAGDPPGLLDDHHAARGPRAGRVRVGTAARPAPQPGDLARRRHHAGRELHRLRPTQVRPGHPTGPGRAVGLIGGVTGETRDRSR